MAEWNGMEWNDVVLYLFELFLGSSFDLGTRIITQRRFERPHMTISNNHDAHTFYFLCTVHAHSTVYGRFQLSNTPRSNPT